VIRGAKHYSRWSPDRGYWYDGLYRVEDHWHAQGRAGFRVWRYRLVRWEEELEVAEPTEQGSADTTPRREASTVLRIIRDTYYAKAVKRLYDYRCQICGIHLQGAIGPYAEAAHIQPLGRPHNGPDTLENLLCLCPNHHVLFDYRAFSIADDLSLIGLNGSLTIHPEHMVRRAYLRYRREHY
jgi:putative restriction endonuclease